MNALLCLTLAIYFEARGEPTHGQYLVGEVVLNRVDSSKFPDNVCDVVFQKHQFEFTTRKSLEMKNEEARLKAEEIAVDLLTGYRVNHKLLWFFNPEKVNPKWAHKLETKFRIGGHVFLRRKS